VRAKSTRAVSIPAASFSLVLSSLLFIPVCSTVLAHSVADSTVAASTVMDVHIGVLGLFHPHQFKVTASAGSALVLHVGEERIVLENSSGVDSANVRISGSDVIVSVGERTARASNLTVTDRKSEPVDFVLAVPGKIARRYHGTLEIKPAAGLLTAIVSMARETAVASVVAAEAAPDTPFEALKAQAVAARSYFVAGRGRHHDFDFCDTTHCQFLREPPAPGSDAARAGAATRDLVLAYDSHPLAAMYTRSCGGRTHTPSEVGLSPSSYPYYTVECKYCRAHPARWSSRLSTQNAAAPHSSDESARLKIARRLGWSAVPSNDFVVKTERDQIMLEGIGEGHGIGLCQSGAAAMAEEGADFRQILSHYYPNTTVVARPGFVGPDRDGQTARNR
jgi:stage II sporulation protein D